MSAPTWSQPPVGLPLDDYLYGYALDRSCGVCVALDKQFHQAAADHVMVWDEKAQKEKKKAKKPDTNAMFRLASEIRNHPGHGK